MVTTIYLERRLIEHLAKLDARRLAERREYGCSDSRSTAPRFKAGMLDLKISKIAIHEYI